MNPVYPYIARLPRSPTILEIGAHIGTDTRAILGLLGPCEYYAFEPDPRNLAELRMLQTVYSFELIPNAVSEIDGPVTFYLSQGYTPKGREHTDSSCLEPPARPGRPWITGFVPVQVESVTLDTFCITSGIERVNFIWADIQGAERRMIDGAQWTLAHTDWLYLECDEHVNGRPRLKDLLVRLPGNWRVELRTPTDALLKHNNGRKCSKC